MTTRTTPATLGIVLAGGQARRMGADKPLMTLAGRPLARHVIERAAPQCAALALNANGDPARYADFDLPVVADSLPGYPGPLAGIQAGLDIAARDHPHIGWVVSLPADCPFLPRDLVARLHQVRLQSGATLVCASSGGRRHPTIGLWPVSLREALRHTLLAERERAAGRWVERFTPAYAVWLCEPADPFFNINTPDDLAAAEAIAASMP